MGYWKTDPGSFTEILTKIPHKFSVSYKVITFGSNYLKVQIDKKWEIQATKLKATWGGTIMTWHANSYRHTTCMQLAVWHKLWFLYSQNYTEKKTPPKKKKWEPSPQSQVGIEGKYGPNLTQEKPRHWMKGWLGPVSRTAEEQKFWMRTTRTPGLQRGWVGGWVSRSLAQIHTGFCTSTHALPRAASASSSRAALLSVSKVGQEVNK